jgi:acetate kinase
MAAALGGLEALVFTGGVGENAPIIRALAVEGLAFLGASIDPDRNASGAGDRFVSTSGGAADVLVVESREDLEIARQVRAVVAAR